MGARRRRERDLVKALGGSDECVVEVPVNLRVGFSVGGFEYGVAHPAVESSWDEDFSTGLGVENRHLGAPIVSALWAAVMKRRE